MGILFVSWWAGAYPARVAVINQNAAVRDLVLLVGGRRIEIGEMRAGESRIVRIPSGEPLEVRFTGSRPRVWRSPETIPPGASVVLYLAPDDRVMMRDRIGAR
ncbi:MAG TPA: hypothetical protein VF962_15030 [Gemmatimonadaceae bacterium]